MKKNEANNLCVSVFKNGTNTNKIQFTQVWINLINKIEKNKSVKKI
jgi:hypothetical protein